MHGKDQHEEAFRLHCTDHSFDEIRDATGISKQTLVRWSVEDHWKERRRKIIDKTREHNDLDIVRHKARMAKKLHQLAMIMIDQVKEKEISSAEGGSNAALNLIKTEMNLLEPKVKGNSLQERVELLKGFAPRVLIDLVQFLSDDPVVRQAIESKKEALIVFVTDNAVKYANEKFKAPEAEKQQKA